MLARAPLEQGGTPALLAPASVERLVRSVRSHFGGSSSTEPPRSAPGTAAEPAVEITLEVNPSTVERARLKGFRDAGVNRLSMGVQSFDDTMLQPSTRVTL